MLFAIASQASPIPSDSLLQRVASAPNDSARVDSYLVFAKSLFWTERDKCKDFTGKARLLAEQINYEEAELDALILEGILYTTQSIPDLAIARLMLAESKALTSNNQRQLGRVYSSLGNVFLSQDGFGEAIEYYNKAVSFFTSIRDSQNITICIHNRAIAYDELGQHEKALAEFSENLAIQETLNLRHSVARTHGSLSEVYRSLGQPEKAIFHGRMAFKQKRALGEVSGLVPAFINLTESFLEEDQIDSAAFYLDQAADIIANNSVDEGHRLEFLKYMGLVDARRGRYKNAYGFISQYAEEKDTLESRERESLVARMQTAFGVEKKDAEIQLLNSQAEVMQAEQSLFKEQNERQRAFILALAISLILVLAGIILLVLFQQARKKAAEQIQAQKSQIELQFEELQKKNGELKKLNEDQKVLVNMIAHDLKAPFTKGTALLGMLQEAGSLDERQQHLIEMVQRSNSQGKRMIEDMLTLRQLDKSKELHGEELLELNPFLEQLASVHLATAAKKDIAIELAIPDVSVTLQTNPEYLERILDNLISNAVKFSQPNRRVFLGLETEEETAVFTIRDEGPGISAEDQTRMFGRFQRLSARPTAGESSSGLGLAVVKALVGHLNGSIEVESILGEGTSFRVRIPLTSTQT